MGNTDSIRLSWNFSLSITTGQRTGRNCVFVKGRGNLSPSRYTDQDRLIDFHLYYIHKDTR